MTTFYLTLAAIGLVLLVAQLLLGAAGGDHADLPDSDGAGHSSFGEGLELLSVRSLSAGAALFGLAGLAMQGLGLPTPLSLPVAMLAGLTGMLVVVRAQRAMLRLERDHLPQPMLAIGHLARVHVSIPSAGKGMGKVTLDLQGHFMELPARTREPSAIPSGTEVLVMDVTDDGVLDVAPTNELLPESA